MHLVNFHINAIKRLMFSNLMSTRNKYWSEKLFCLTETLRQTFAVLQKSPQFKLGVSSLLPPSSSKLTFLAHNNEPRAPFSASNFSTSARDSRNLRKPLRRNECQTCKTKMPETEVPRWQFTKAVCWLFESGGCATRSHSLLVRGLTNLPEVSPKIRVFDARKWNFGDKGRRFWNFITRRSANLNSYNLGTERQIR